MEARATLCYARISPRKVKIVIDLIRNKPVGIALAILKHTPKAASPLVEKLLLSAIANAENNNNMAKDDLYVSECFANGGPILKRIMPRAQGRAYQIRKRTSHTTLVVREAEAAKELKAIKEVKEVKTVKPVKEVKAAKTVKTTKTVKTAKEAK